MRTKLELRKPLFALRVATALVVAVLVAFSEPVSGTHTGSNFYKILNLGTLCQPSSGQNCDLAGSRAFALNNTGEVVGISHRFVSLPHIRAFRTSPNQPINPATRRASSSVRENTR